jgi:hypothetical protein
MFIPASYRSLSTDRVSVSRSHQGDQSVTVYRTLTFSGRPSQALRLTPDLVTPRVETPCEPRNPPPDRSDEV